MIRIALADKVLYPDEPLGCLEQPATARQAPPGPVKAGKLEALVRGMNRFA